MATTSDRCTSSTKGLQRLIVLGLHGIALMLWGLHLYVRSLPATTTAIPEPGSAEADWWGLWPITYAPRWFVLLATILLLAAMLGSWWALWRTRRQHGEEQCPLRHAASPPWLFPTLCGVAVLMVGAFFAFPIVHTRWGDAYILSNAIAWPDPALRLTHSWQAPLDVFLHSRLWLWLHEPFQWEDAAPAYRLLSPLAGALYLTVVLLLSRDERLAPSWLVFGLFASLGVVQLFFGYIENYSFAAAGVLAYLWLGMGVLRGEKPLWLAALILALTNATHPSTIVLAPSLLYCGWCTATTRRPATARAFWSAAWQIGLPMVAVASGVILLMELGNHGLVALLTTDRPGGSDARFFVPLFATSTRWEHYTMFSWPHLRDFINEQLLVAPVVLPSLLFIAPFYVRWGRAHMGRKRGAARAADGERDTLGLFLLIASLCYILFTWVWNPDYGGQRDWDLFSLAAIPTTLLLVVLLPRVLQSRQLLVSGVLPILIVQLCHTAAWVYQNTLPWEWP